MVGNTFWSTGHENEYGMIAQAINRASKADLQRFVDLIRVDGAPLMDAHQQAFFGGTLPEELQAVEENWFGADSMWFYDCTLTPDQIHAVMREARARTAELLLAGAGGIKLFIQCGHPRFRTVITWDGAKEADAEVWAPTPSPGTEVHVWVYTPYNCAYGDKKLLGSTFKSQQEDAKSLLACIEKFPPPLNAFPPNWLESIIEYLGAARLIFREAHINATGGGGPLPDASELAITWRPDFAEPPADPRSHGPAMEVAQAIDIGPQMRSGIEISWPDAGHGQLLVHEEDRVAAGQAPAGATAAGASGYYGSAQPSGPTSFLNGTLSWKTPTEAAAAMLEDLQANILKAHVRNHAVLSFVRFEDAAAGREFLQAVAPHVKSAREQLEAAEEERDGGRGPKVTRPYVGIGVSKDGYDMLEIEPPTDKAFLDGMKHRAALGDPPADNWEPEYGGEIHAVVIVAGATEDAVHDKSQEIDLLDGDGVSIFHHEEARSLTGSFEHFGFVDGRSQPLFLDDDIERERLCGGGVSTWSPGLALDRVIVRDLAAGDGEHFGSYMVFRKLEQHVERFRAYEQALAAELGLTSDDQRAGALLIGRFQDGTPLTLQSSPGMSNPVTNDFNYYSDAEGMKCPHVAHARIVNDRTGGDRKHLMARRGVPYGTDAEQGGSVGLLFMALNANIAEQFEFVQRRANEARVFDPIIGQVDPRPSRIALPTAWAGNATKRKDVGLDGPFVTMRGGEYFFLPSLTFLSNPG